MNYKRKRCKNQRHGCLMCKYWKINGARKKDKLKHSEFVHFLATEKEIEEFKKE